MLHFNHVQQIHLFDICLPEVCLRWQQSLMLSNQLLVFVVQHSIVLLNLYPSLSLLVDGSVKQLINLAIFLKQHTIVIE